MTHLTQSASWQALKAMSADLPHMRELFAENAQRFEQLSLKDCGLLLDYSKNRLTDAVLQELLKLAREAGLEQKK